MPVILYQLWAFVAPGLTDAEKRAIRPWVPLALLFFAIGVASPTSSCRSRSSSCSRSPVAASSPRTAAGPYFDFVTTMFLAFGLVLEFPILLYGLSLANIVTSQQLRSWRRMRSSSSRSSPPSRRPVAISSARSCWAGRCTSCTS